jgi:autotransporter-associated beta strand protein
MGKNWQKEGCKHVCKENIKISITNSDSHQSNKKHMALHREIKKLCFLLPTAALWLAVEPSAQAANTNTWKGAMNGYWNNAVNWSSGATPAAGDSLAFSGNSQTVTTNDLAAGAATNGLNFVNDGSSGNTAAFTLSGTAIALSTNIFLAGYTNSNPITDIINLDMTMVTGGKITFNGTNRNLTINGVISDAGSNLTLQVIGSVNLYGTVTLAGVNTFGGQININGGVVVANTISNSGAPCSLGTNSLIRFGNVGSTGTLLFNGSGATIDRQIQIGNNTAAGPKAADTGGATIQADGPGALVFTNAYFNMQQANVIASKARALTVQGGNAAVNEIQGVIQDNVVGASGTAAVALTKDGINTWKLSGANTYTGMTTVSNGTLLVDGSLAGAATVQGGTLGGHGTISGAVAVKAGATLAPGDNAIGTLTINNTLALNSTSQTLMEINPAAGANDAVVGLTSVTYGGALAVNNLGGAVTNGSHFTLFSASSSSGNFSSVSVSPSGGLAWNFDPASGVLSASSTLAINPTNISLTVSGNNTLQLTWPGDHLGWLVQSNSGHLEVPSDWYDIPGTDAGTNYIITISLSQTNAFYRLRKP